jgi:hypothetical protein
MQINGIQERIPQAEKVFFKENIELRDRASGLVGYARQVGRLPAEMEEIVARCPDAACNYAAWVANIDQVPQNVIDSCAASVSHLIRMAGAIRRRIVHLEHMIADPDSYSRYATALYSRVPELEERILFSGSFPDDELAKAALILVEHFSGHGWGGIPADSPSNDPRIRGLLKAHKPVVKEYMGYLTRRGAKLPEEFHMMFAGDGEMLYRLADHLGRRLPPELESTWEGARKELVNYCGRYVKSRLPEELENRLLGDEDACHNYAFNIVRGFAPVRLSDSLHAFMTLSGGQQAKRYISECHRLANLEKNPGNT